LDQLKLRLDQLKAETLLCRGRPPLSYYTNKHDQRSMLDGVLMQLQVLKTQRRTRFVTLHTFTAFSLRRAAQGALAVKRKMRWAASLRIG
jgi:hypothetical protein